jgi:hypothetical protein
MRAVTIVALTLLAIVVVAVVILLLSQPGPITPAP